VEGITTRLTKFGDFDELERIAITNVTILLFCYDFEYKIRNVNALASAQAVLRNLLCYHQIHRINYSPDCSTSC